MNTQAPPWSAGRGNIAIHIRGQPTQRFVPRAGIAASLDGWSQRRPSSTVSTRLSLIAMALAVGTACTSAPVSKTSLFSVPGGPTPPTEFYELPFPNDIRRGVDGHPNLSDYPRLNSLVDRYTTAISSDLDGFGLNAAAFVRFGGPIDPASLPGTPEVSLTDGGSVYLVDVDPLSPDRGQKIPLRFRFEPKKGSTIGPHWLSALPYPGFPLNEGTIYALVVTNRVRSLASQEPVEASEDFIAIASPNVPSNAALASAQHKYATLWAYLDEPGGDERNDVVNAAVFTTQHATDVTTALRKKVWTLPAPVASGIARLGAVPEYAVYDGTFPSPNFQTGDPPYLDTGGQIELGDDGLPVVKRTENLRVSFSIPSQTMPANGWPVTIFATGAGGDYHSYGTTGVASTLAAEGIAVISIDQVLSGPRDPVGLPGDAAFYNFSNPYAAMYNALQGAADNFSLLRLVLGLSYVEAPIGTESGRTVYFDPTKIYFFGHSQGGITGLPFVAFEPDIKAAVLSGTGGLLYEAVLNKTQPIDISTVIKSYVPDDPFDEFNPVLSLLQTWAERSDAANYGPLLARKPVTGVDGQPLAPKDIYQSEGFVDPVTPNPCIQALATAIGGNQVKGADGLVKQTIVGLVLRGREVLGAPVTTNLAGRTVVLAQYEQPVGGDGHIVALFLPTAGLQWSKFLGTRTRTGIATLVAP